MGLSTGFGGISTGFEQNIHTMILPYSLAHPWSILAREAIS
jgi:hypothetical protein